MNDKSNRERSDKRLDDNNPANRDPITGQPGHTRLELELVPQAAASGAAIGAVAGPVGAVAGAVVGAVVGGLGGKAAAEAVDPTVHDAYWEKNYRSRPYATSTTEYKELQPAYRYGWESAGRSRSKSFDDVAPALGTNWHVARGDCPLDWDRAKPAVRDAWEYAASQRK